MKTIITTILLFISFLTFCQSAYQFADSTKKWNTIYYGFWSWGIAHCGGTKTNKLQGEVVFNDTIFFNVYETQDSLQLDWGQIGYLREDTVSKKVYYSEWLPEEIGLLYDFNLLVGDSAIIDNYYVGFEDVLLICDSIDSININGSLKKRFYLHSPDYGGADIWIEGVGSKFGLLYSGVNCYGMTGGGTDLLCCSKNDTVIYMDSTYNSCYIEEFYPKITSESYDTAYLNTFYEFQVQISDTINIDSFALIGDVIPEGFEFNEATGFITGMPTTVGSFPCIITTRNYDIGFLTSILYSDINVVLPTTVKDQPKQSEIKIYPNPFSTNFSISSNIKLKDFYLEIFNCEGKMIEKKTITEIDCKVDCSNYKNGIYLLKITDKNQKIFKIEKIIKK